VTGTLPSGGGDPVGLTAGAVFAGHRIESEIGRGGMGVVYRARHVALDRERALKLITPSLSMDAEFRGRFQRESRLAASIEHPNVIPVHHAGEEGGQLYLSMRLVEGSDLREIVAREGPLSLGRAAKLVSGIAAGLDAAHEKGLVHRDAKPGNVLVEGEHVFLTDFGISRIAAGGGTLTSSGELLGSVDYVAPEQIEGERGDHRVDVYALGCILYFTLTAEPPFPRDNDLAKLFAHSNAPRPRPSEVDSALPSGIDEIVARAMTIDPAERFPSAGELAADLARIADGATWTARSALPDTTADAQTTSCTSRGRRRWGLLIAAALAAAVAAAAVSVVLVAGGNETSPSGSTALPASGRQARTIDTIKVGHGPTALTVGAGSVWVAATGQRVVDRINPASDRPARLPIPVGGAPNSVAVGFGSIWVVDHTRGALVRLDPSQRTRPLEIPVGLDPNDVTVEDRWVWVSNGGSDSVSRVDPSTNRVNRTVHVGDAPRSLANGDGAVWVANINGRSVSKIDPQRAITVGKPVAVGQRPNDLAVGGGYVWVTDVFNGTVTRVDPGSLKTVGSPIEVGSHPRGVKTAFGSVWVANGGDGTVTRIDPHAATIVGRPIRVGRDPADIAVGKSAIWTADSGDSTVTKIRP
jgi:YVTN family beta-propeller protein